MGVFSQSVFGEQTPVSIDWNRATNTLNFQKSSLSAQGLFYLSATKDLSVITPCTGTSSVPTWSGAAWGVTNSVSACGFATYLGITNGVVSSFTPLATAGEYGYLYCSNGSFSWSTPCGSSPGGSSGDLQYNNSGSFGGITPTTGYLYYNGASYAWQTPSSGYTSYNTSSAVTSTSSSTSSAVTSTCASTDSAVTSIDFGMQSYNTSSFVTSVSDYTSSFVSSISDNTGSFVTDLS